ncbi:MAG: glycosyltransferase [Methanomassiliicoccales archaeon]|nr:glycosyltransferase [Methanomassiliicoccales archaeon]
MTIPSAGPQGCDTRRPRCVFINFTGRQYGFSINDKIVDQWMNLSRQGTDAVLVLAEPNDIRVIHDEKSLADAQASADRSSHFTILSMIRQMIRIRSTIRELNNGNTMFYLRHPSLSEIPMLLHSRKRNLVLEINGLYKYEIDEDSLLDRLRLLFEKGVAAIASKRTIGIVSVTNEIGGLFYPGGFTRTKRAVIANGVNIGRFKMRNPSPDRVGPLRILAVANFNCWHGYDKLLDALTEPDIEGRMQVYLIGEGPEKQNLVHKVNKMALRNVHFLPPMKGADLDELFDSCDIALGVLAIERKGLVEMCPLKHREYCARGVPFVMSGTDVDFPADSEFVLNAPIGQNIDIEQVLDFAKRMREWRDHPKVMRRYAEEHLDWAIKMGDTASFLVGLEHGK